MEAVTASVSEHYTTPPKPYTDVIFCERDRPSWNRLVEGVKNGEITACICKDMSRIGRDHLQVGFFH